MNIDVDAHVIKDDIKHSGIRRHQKQLPYASCLISQPKDCTNSFDSMTFEQISTRESARLTSHSRRRENQCTLALISSPI